MDFPHIVISASMLIVSAGFVLFFRKFFSELGKRTAELTTAAQVTRLVEQVRDEFNKNLETFRSLLAKRNIAYQSTQVEFARLRFERIDQLFAHIYELQKYSKSNLFFYEDDADVSKKRSEFRKLYEKASDSLNRSMLYMSEGLFNSAFALIEECFTSYMAFIRFYHTDVGKAQHAWLYQNPRLLEEMLAKNNDSLDKFRASVDKFPELLRAVKNEFNKLIEPENGG